MLQGGSFFFQSLKFERNLLHPDLRGHVHVELDFLIEILKLQLQCLGLGYHGFVLAGEHLLGQLHQISPEEI